VESTIFGVSVRAWLAMFATGAGFVFIFCVTFLIGGDDNVSAALTAVVGFINLALGYYLGQKSIAQ
jgi:hypothetical protein